MTTVAIRVCHTDDEAREAIVRVAAQLGIPEASVSVVRCAEASYVHAQADVRDVALSVLLVVGRKD